MYVCICKAVTDTTIRRAVDEGATTLAALSRETGAGTQCGGCLETAREILDQALSEQLPEFDLRVVCAG